MVFFWSGLGFLVPLSMAPAFLVVTLLFGDDYGKIENVLLYLLTAVFCFITDYFVKKYRRSTCEENILRDEKTQKEKKVMIKNMQNVKTGETTSIIVKDTFFGLPIWIWSIIFAACSVVPYIAN